MLFSKIKIGDIFESPLRCTGSGIVYTVTDKVDGLIEIRSSYQHPNLPETMWKKPSNRIFNRRIYCAPQTDRRTTSQRVTDEMNEMRQRISELESDVLVLVGRLYGESDNTFAPETYEVMKRWRPVFKEKYLKMKA